MIDLYVYFSASQTAPGYIQVSFLMVGKDSLPAMFNQPRIDAEYVGVPENFANTLRRVASLIALMNT
jgi:hypothetical protein